MTQEERDTMVVHVINSDTLVEIQHRVTRYLRSGKLRGKDFKFLSTARENALAAFRNPRKPWYHPKPTKKKRGPSW